MGIVTQQLAGGDGVFHRVARRGAALLVGGVDPSAEALQADVAGAGGDFYFGCGVHVEVRDVGQHLRPMPSGRRRSGDSKPRSMTRSGTTQIAKAIVSSGSRFRILRT